MIDYLIWCSNESFDFATLEVLISVLFSLYPEHLLFSMLKQKVFIVWGYATRSDDLYPSILLLNDEYLHALPSDLCCTPHFPFTTLIVPFVFL